MKVSIAKFFTGLGAFLANGWSRVDKRLRYDKVFELKSDNPRTLNYKSVKIMTVNTHSWSYQGSDILAELAKVIGGEDPDIICLQEVTLRGKKLEQLQKLGYNVVFVPTYFHLLRGPFGNAIASRAPTELLRTRRLPNPKTVSPRVSMTVSIGMLTILNTHLSTHKQERTMQLEKLRSEVEDVDIITMDANTGERTVCDHLDMAPGNQKTLSFPANNPKKAIDLIINTSGIVVSTQTFDIASDHLAVMRTIHFKTS